MSLQLRFYLVWGTNGAGERIERHIFAQDSFNAKHKFYVQTGILADGSEEE